MKVKPEDQSIGGKSIRARPGSVVEVADQDVAEVDARVGLDGVGPAPQGASSLDQTQWMAHAFAGNTEILGALSGEVSGPWVDAVTGALAAETAGVQGPGEALGSNQAMLSAMRDENGVSPQAGLALKRLQTGGGRSLPGPVKARMEAAFGHDFSHVRIHTDAAAKDASQQVSAHAFAMGPDIYFGAGEFRPGSAEGERLIAHELTHVVQADEGRLPSGGGVSKPTDAAEVEAYANESIILDRIASPEVDAAVSETEVSAAAPAVESEGMATQSSAAVSIMRSEDQSPEGSALGVDSSQEGAMDTFYESLGEYVGYDVADDVLSIEADYLEQIENNEATLMGQPLVAVEHALTQADHACHDVFDFIWDLPLNRDGEHESEVEATEQSEQSEQSAPEQEGPKATDAEREELNRLLILADAHIGLTGCVTALVLGPLFASVLGMGAQYAAMLADMQLFAAAGRRAREVERAIKKAEDARAALLAEKGHQLGETITAAVTVPLVTAAAGSVLVAFGAASPILIAGGALLVGAGYGSLFETPDMGQLLGGVKETGRIGAGVAGTYEAAEQAGSAKEALGKTKNGFAGIRHAIAAMEVGVAGYELWQALDLDLTHANEVMERWEEEWPEVAARYQAQIQVAQGNHAMMQQILATLPEIEAQMAEYQTVIDENTI
jgi:hypothetical protein